MSHAVKHRIAMPSASCFLASALRAQTVVRLIAGVLLSSCLVITPALASSVKKIAWSDLRDPSNLAYEDPFRALSPSQIGVLRQIVRQRERAKSATGGDADQLKASLSQLVANLAEDGIDADALLAERFSVKKRRQRAATAGNPKLDGQIVELSGFTLPESRPGSTSVVVVPDRVQCSHRMMPPPNQMVRALDPKRLLKRDYLRPVRLVGLLRIKPNVVPVFLIDGTRMLPITFELTIRQAQSLGQALPSVPPKNLPVFGRLPKPKAVLGSE